MTGGDSWAGQMTHCLSFGLEMMHLLPPTQTSQMVTRLLEEAKQGSALVLALLEKREA